MIITVKDHLKPIPVDEFGEHVQHMHTDRDKWFEMEYNVHMYLLKSKLKYSL